jgi:hypothetical protein
MQIIKTGISRPPVMLIYGEHKTGKSTFAAGCPKPLFIQTEAGLEGIHTDAFPLCHSFSDFEKCLDAVEKTKDFKTLVIDSADWLEALIFKKVCESHKVTDIGQIPYGKGQVAAEGIWRDILDRLAIINRNQKMMIVLIAHATIQRFEDPERESYDRYAPDLHKRSSNLISEFVDILGYVTLKVSTQSKEAGFGAVSTKAKTTGERLLFVDCKGGFSAGNRYGLPSPLPLEWKAIGEHLKKRKPDSSGNLAEINQEKKLAVV